MDAKTLLTVKFSEKLTDEQARKCLQCACDIFDLPYSGWSVPIEFFNRNEKLIRRVMRAQATKYNPTPRVFYRGPRWTNRLKYSTSKPSMTRRCDAVAVVIDLGFRVC